MKFKQLGITILALALLTGCGAAAPQTANSAKSPASTMQPQASDTNSSANGTPAPTEASADNKGEGEDTASAALPNKTSAQQALITMLDTMEQEITVGVPGSHMNTVRIAARLLDWGVDTGLTADEVRQVTLDWLMNKGNDESVAINEQFTAVDEAYRSLLGDGGAEVLSAANVEDSAYPWSDEPLEAVEAIMNAVGLR